MRIKESPPLRILFVSNNLTTASEMQFLANRLSDFAECKIIGEVLNKSDPSTSLNKTYPHSWFKFIKSLIVLPVFYKRLRFKKKLLAQISLAKSHLTGVQFVFLSGDRSPETIEGAIIKLCKEQGIPTAIAPLFIYGEKGDLLSIRKNSPVFSASEAEYKKYKNVIIKDQNPTSFISFYPGYQLKVFEELGYLSSNPWVMGGGQSDYVLVLSDFWKKRLVEKGVPENKTVITGHPKYDSLFETIKKKNEIRIALSQTYHLDLNEHWITFAPPPLYEHNILSAEEHWRELDFIKETLLRIGKPILLSLHPKMNFQEYKAWIKNTPIVLVETPLQEWLVASDLFVSSFSTTTEWAIGLGIKSIMLDYYGFSIDFYDSMRNVLISKDKSKLGYQIQDYLKQPFQLDIDTSFDGQAILKIKSLIKHVTKK